MNDQLDNNLVIGEQSMTIPNDESGAKKGTKEEDQSSGAVEQIGKMGEAASGG